MQQVNFSDKSHACSVSVIEVESHKALECAIIYCPWISFTNAYKATLCLHRRLCRKNTIWHNKNLDVTLHACKNCIQQHILILKKNVYLFALLFQCNNGKIVAFPLFFKCISWWILNQGPFGNYCTTLHTLVSFYLKECWDIIRALNLYFFPNAPLYYFAHFFFSSSSRVHWEQVKVWFPP